MSAKTNAINLDDFDEDEPSPISITFVPIEIKDKDMLDAVLAAKRSAETKRAIRKVLLGFMATLITIFLVLT